MRGALLLLATLSAGCPAPDLTLGGPIHRDGAAPQPDDSGAQPWDAWAGDAGCAAACAHFGACVLTPDAGCEAARDEGDRARLEDRCREGCAPRPGVAGAILAREACGAVVDYVRETMTGVALDCVRSAALLDECQALGARIAGCVVASCAAAEDVLEGLTKLFWDSCNQNVAAEVLALPDVERLSDPALPCDDPRLAGTINAVVSGPLADLCQGTRPIDLPSCRRACANVVGCFRPQGLVDIADFDVCLYACLVQANLQDTFRCTLRRRDCQRLAACF